MAFLSLEQEARIWASLDDNLREKVRSGELTFEEAGKYVVPIGDVELATAREEYPARPLSLDSIEEVAPESQYDLGTMRDTSLLRLGAFGDTVGAGLDADVVDQAIAIEEARDDSFATTLGKKWDKARTDNEKPGPATPWYLGAGAQLAKGALAGIELGTDAVTALGEAAQTEMQAAVLKEDYVAREAYASLTSLSENVEQLEATRNALNALPENPYSKAFVENFDQGNYAAAAWAAPLAIGTTFGEQAPTLLAQLGITAGTYALTRSKAATARAAALAGGLGGLSEYGSDYLSIIETMPEEDRRNLTKVRKALDMAKEAALARTVVEAILPRNMAKLGASTVGRVGSDLAGQMVSGALGESAAATIMGQERSAGELAMEALADSAGVATESIPSLRKAAEQDRIDVEAEKYVASERNRAFAESIREIDDQNRAEANRVAFDAEAEADRAIQSLKDGEALNRGEQIEMPFGSDMAGDQQSNDRIPTITDMFSGESRVAPAVQRELETRVPLDQMPEETDEAFEIRQQRTTDARNQIDARKQKEFKDKKTREEGQRKLLAEDQTVLKHERQLLSTTDITREAKRLVAVEAEGVRKQRAGIIKDPKRLDAVVKAYERKRLPELIDNVRNRRLARVNEARDRTIAEENRQVALDEISVDNELAARQTERDTKAKAAAAPVATDLFESQAGQGELILTPQKQPKRTTLTEKQALAAGQLERQKQNEKLAPAKKAAEAAAIAAELPTVEKALAQAEQKKATTTQKLYAKKERDAINSIAEAELSVPNDKRTIEQKREAAATRVAAWRKANPRPASVPAPVKDLTEVAQEIAKKEDSNKQRAETKKTNDAIRREIRNGKTPEEAAEIVNRQLSEQEDADLRSELGQDTSKSTTKNLDESMSPTQVPEVTKKKNDAARKAHPLFFGEASKALDEGQVDPVRLLDAILNDPSTSPLYKSLARRIRPLLKMTTLKASYGTKVPWVFGQYSARDQALYFNAITPETVLHEALHGILATAIDFPMFFIGVPGMRARIESLNTALELVRARTISNLNERHPGVGDGLARDGGPLGDIHELISYFMTDEGLRNVARSLPASARFQPPPKPLLRQFWDAVLRFFRIAPTEEQFSMLDELESHVGQLFNEMDNAAVAGWGPNARKAPTGPERNQLFTNIATVDRSRTMLEAVGKYPELKRALEATKSFIDTVSENLPGNFLKAAWQTPLGEMSNRTLEDGNTEAYRRFLGQVSRDMAEWAGMDNVMVTSDGTLMPLFHGSTADGSFVIFRLPNNTDQLGIHVTPAPPLASSFNYEQISVPGRLNLMFGMVGRMKNPIRLRDRAAWGPQQLLMNDLPIALSRDIQSIMNDGDMDADTDADMRDVLREHGYDGVVYLNRYEIPGVARGDVGQEAANRLRDPKNANLDAKFAASWNGNLKVWVDPITGIQHVPASTRRHVVGKWLSEISDADFKQLFPETSESYIFLRQEDLKSISNDAPTSAKGIHNADAGVVGDIESVTGLFTNPTKKVSKSKWKTNFFGSVVDTLTAGAGMSRAITEVMERAQSESAAITKIAEDYYSRIDSSLERQAPKTPDGQHRFREEFAADVAAFENADGRITKAGAAKALRAKYGTAARTYFKMRRLSDKLSREILSQRLSNPERFTAAEAKIYRSIRDNIGSYYTRVYAAHVKDLGPKRAKQILKHYHKVAKAMGLGRMDGGTITPAMKEAYDMVKDAIVFVRDELLSIPDISELESMPILKLQRMAEAWGLRPAGTADLDNPMDTDMRRLILVEALDAQRDKNDTQKEHRALNLVESMLYGKDGSVVLNYYRGNMQDRTIVTDRDGVPPVLRKLLGEFTDVPLRGMMTIMKQGEFLMRTRAFNELLRNQLGKSIIADADFPESDKSSKTASGKPAWKRLDGPAYGVLDGMWVTAEMADRVEDSAEIERTFSQAMAIAEQRPLAPMEAAAKKLIKGWAKTAGVLKMAQLVLNPVNVLLNFGGGALTLISNGNGNPKHAYRALKTAANLVNSANKGVIANAETLKVIRAGITDSAFLGDIRAVELEQVRQAVMSAYNNTAESAWAGAKERGGTAFRMWKETYAMADVVWKIANFYAEEAKLEAFYKAEGENVSAAQIEREAAQNTNNSNFSYKRVPAIIKSIERGGITFVMPYIYETFRAPVGSFFVGAQDISRARQAKTAEGARIMYASGAKRTIGAFLALGGAQAAMYGTVKMALNAMGESDDEEWEWVEDLKAFLPDFKQESDYIYAGEKNGMPVLVEMSRIDPFGPATELYSLFLNGASPKEFAEAAKRLWIDNPYGVGIVAALSGQGSTATRIERISPKTYDILSNYSVGRYGARALDKALPSWFTRALDPENEAPEDEIFLRMLTNLGLTVHQVNDERAVKYSANALIQERNVLTEDMNHFLKTATDLEDNELLSRYTALQEREAEAYEEVDNLYNGMLKLGYSPESALTALSDRKVPKEYIAMLYTGGWRPEGSGILDISNIERSFKTMVEDGDIPLDKKQRYLDNIRRVIRLADEGKLTVQE